MTPAKFYSESPAWHRKIGDIHALLERGGRPTHTHRIRSMDLMLDAIGNSLHKYIDIATETVADVGVIVGVNGRAEKWR
jgi:hypothetical protein